MAKPVMSVGRYARRVVTTSATAYKAAAEAKASTAAKEVVTELTLEQVQGEKVADKVTSNLGQFRLVQDTFHRPAFLAVVDGKEKWQGGTSALFRRVRPDGTEIRVDAFIPQGWTADMAEGEIGDLVVEHDPLRPGEAFFKIARKNVNAGDDGKAVVDGYVGYTPRRSCRLIAFNGHPVYQVAAVKTATWAEASCIAAEAQGTKMADEAIEAGRKAKEEELAAKIAALQAELAKVKEGDNKQA